MTNTNTTPLRRPYLALSFDTVEVGNGSQKQLKLCNRYTHELGHDKENFLGMSAGKCFLTLRVLYNLPKQSSDSNSNVIYSYDHEMWHMERDGKTMADNNPITMMVAYNHLGDGIGNSQTFTFSGSGSDIVQLGEINLIGGDYEFKLVGDVRHCFWNQPIFRAIYRFWRFKKPAENLKYYIRVN